MVRARLPALMSMLLTLASCAMPEPPPVAQSPGGGDEQAIELEPDAPPRKDRLKHLLNRKIKPLPERPLNAKADCSFRDENGYRGRLSLDVREASVKRFEANVDVPKHGSCRFRLADFQQIDSMPNVVLAAKRGECRVRFWEQEHQVTVAFRDCRAECSGRSLDYLWPILVDNRKGSCA